MTRFAADPTQDPRTSRSPNNERYATVPDRTDHLVTIGFTLFAGVLLSLATAAVLLQLQMRTVLIPLSLPLIH